MASEYFNQVMLWQTTDDGEFPYETTVNQKHMKIRVNDFPAEPLYTFLINNDVICSFDQWPTNWHKALCS